MQKYLKLHFLKLVKLIYFCKSLSTKNIHVSSFSPRIFSSSFVVGIGGDEPLAPSIADESYFNSIDLFLGGSGAWGELSLAFCLPADASAECVTTPVLSAVLGELIASLPRAFCLDF